MRAPGFAEADGAGFGAAYTLPDSSLLCQHSDTDSFGFYHSLNGSDVLK